MFYFYLIECTSEIISINDSLAVFEMNFLKYIVDVHQSDNAWWNPVLSGRAVLSKPCSELLISRLFTFGYRNTRNCARKIV